MKSQYVSDLKQGQSVNTVFVVRDKVIREKRDGSPYVNFELVDKTGSLRGVMWDLGEDVIRSINKDDFVTVSGTVTLYQDRLQLTISTIGKLNEDEVDLSDFLPTSPKEIEVMWEELKNLMAKIRDPFLSRLLQLLFDDSEFQAAFLKAPAATKLHQPYLGGLLEHTLNVTKACEQIKDIYSFINADLLLASALLHDIGKVDEYQYKRTISPSDEGRLIGHLILGYERINSKISAIQDFPKELGLKLGHIILSHHGELEWGSPKVPMLLEAIVLHYIDNLDAKVDIFRRAQESQKDSTSRWSEYLRELGRFIYLGERFQAREELEE